MLRPELLKEILDFNFLCIEDAAIVQVLRGWGIKEDLLQPLVEALEARVQATIFEFQPARKPGEYSENLLFNLWSRYCKAGERGAFLGYCVVVTLGPQQADMLSDRSLTEIGRSGNIGGLCQGWIKWELPHSHVFVMDLGFSCKITSAVSFQILCSEDGDAWHLAHESKGQDIAASVALPCKLPLGWVKCFKVQVLAGQMPAYKCCLRIRGIFQTD